ncbi:pectate lyase [Arthrobacter sp. CAN_A214]|uniref:pectate lyase family protein n=1 Tax=Arthrobacter sp. CAN_A214 TaxID=2787720 RepID=UPI0018CA9074
MSRIRSVLVLSCAISLTAGIAAAAPAGANPPSDHGGTSRTPLERQVLPDGDGFASVGAGTTGGAAATQDRVYDVTTRAELSAALAEAGDEPKIVRVHGELLGNADAAGSPLSCEDYAEGTGYTLQSYLDAYDPATWGRDAEPAGEQEEARRAAAENQKQTMLLQVPSNTTIVGASPDSALIGLSLQINGVSNVIVRNLNHKAVSDCFPQWDPTDGDTGNWNSAYDMVQIINSATNVWVDHNFYTDDPNFDDEAPEYFDRPFQQHDGSIDVTNGSDLVTVSYNRFADRDKLMLIGSTDNPARGDRGKLRVTLHSNEFVNIGQRAPRLRFGQVDAYNNHFVIDDAARVPYGYSLGVGVESHLWAEANAFTLDSDVDPASIIKFWKGTTITTVDNTINQQKVDLLAAYNAKAPEAQQLVEDTSWQPTLRTKVHPAQAVPALLKKQAGPILEAGAK